MKKNCLGMTGIQVTPLCFGTWSLGGAPAYQFLEDEKAFEVIDSVLDLGINFIDTAPLYGFGRSENLLGQALLGRRKNVILSTKCGFQWTEHSLHSLRKSVSRDNILRECEASLKRLQTDWIDLYLIHWHDSKTPIAESMKAMEELKSQGLIKSYGVCNFSLDLLKKASQHGEITALQSRLSRLREEITLEMRQFCIKNNIAIQSYTPLERGLLSDASENNLREKKEWAVDQAFKNAPKNYREKREEWASEAHSEGLSLAQASLRWVFQLEGVSSVIVGSTNVDHMRENVDIFRRKESLKKDF